MAANSNAKVKPFGMADKVGYLFGDFGNDFTFMLSSMFMMKFYTDVMGVAPAIVGTLMMAARFVDAVTDVTMGQIVDRSKPTKDGKFKPWIRRCCGPLGISAFLIFQSGFAGMSMGFKVFWMFLTYLMWGSIFYTSVNIPYGSMASAVTSDSNERAQLSTFRSMGAALASLVIGTFTPMFAYVTVDGATVLSGSRMTIIAGIMLLLGMLGMTGMHPYLFPVYYGSASAQSMASLVGNLASLFICAPLAAKVAAAIGKKETAILGCAVSAASWIVCLFLRPDNAFVFVGFYVVANTALNFFNYIIWAMITDVIDDAEVKNGIREDGTIYSVYSFARKLGQAISSGMIGGLMTAIGYTGAVASNPSAYPEVLSNIFVLSCVIPAIGLIAVILALVFIYPLNKARVDANVLELKKRRGEA